MEKRPETVLQDGSKYTGEWLGTKKHGYGVKLWQDGTRYEGQWLNDKANGQGTLRHADGDEYTGTSIFLAYNITNF